MKKLTLAIALLACSSASANGPALSAGALKLYSNTSPPCSAGDVCVYATGDALKLRLSGGTSNSLALISPLSPQSGNISITGTLQSPTILGGTTAAQYLTLQSTSSGTAGDVVFKLSPTQEVARFTTNVDGFNSPGLLFPYTAGGFFGMQGVDAPSGQTGTTFFFSGGNGGANGQGGDMGILGGNGGAGTAKGGLVEVSGGAGGPAGGNGGDAIVSGGVGLTGGTPGTLWLGFAGPPASPTHVLGPFVTDQNATMSTINGTTIPSTSTLVTTSATQTLTSKSMDGGSNTFTNIPSGAITGASLTVGTSSPLSGGGLVALGGSLTLTCPTCVVTSGSYADPAWVTSLAGAKITGTVANATTASNLSGSITESQVTGLTSDLAAKQSATLTSSHVLVGNVSNVATDVAVSGDATIANTGALSLASTAVTAGSYGDASHVSAVTFDAKGRATAATSTPVLIAVYQVTSLVTDLAGKQPTGNYLTALSSDVVASGPGSAAATIQAGVVTYSKIQNISATSRFLGRKTAGAGSAEELSATDAKTILAISSSDVSGLGTLATLNSVDLSGANATGTLAAGRFPALTGDVTTSAGALGTTIAAGSVTLAKQAALAANSIQGNNTGVSATPIALTASQTKTLLAIAATDLTATGTPSSTTYLRGDNTWATVSGGYATIDANATPLTQRTVLNFSSAFSAADNAGSTRTDIGIASAGVTDSMLASTYALLAGRSGGQTLSGGAATSTDTLVLKSYASGVAAITLSETTSTYAGHNITMSSGSSTNDAFSIAANSQTVFNAAWNGTKVDVNIDAAFGGGTVNVGNGNGSRGISMGQGSNVTTATFGLSNGGSQNRTTSIQGDTLNLVSGGVNIINSVFSTAGGGALTVKIDSGYSGGTVDIGGGTTRVLTLGDGSLITNINVGKSTITTQYNGGFKIPDATGTATLSGGTVTVSTALVTASSRLFLSHKGGNVTNAGFLSPGTIVAGTSFVINSTNASDTDTVNWWVVN